jgi:multicomponent Na+:H+ antiporter subunit G
VGEVAALIGACFVLAAAVGVQRFRDPLARLHALSKASTLGVLLVLGGAALTLSNSADRTSLVLAMVLQLATSPVSATVIGRSVYRSEHRSGRETPSS